jgi:DMSO/TMAO reductase YedYZ molybdopterin-dependent catalytic subunit
MIVFLRYLVLAILLGTPDAAQSPSVLVETGVRQKTFSAIELSALPQDTIRARIHESPEQVFVGPLLSALLRDAGVRLDSLRGRALSQYVVIEARDNYHVVFSIAELSSAFTPRRIILAVSVDGHPLSAEEGPVRLVVEGELRPARWVRQVSAIRVRSVP